MSKSLKKVWNVVSSILVALVVILALLLVGARVAGLQVFTVLSGSMEPTYHTGSLIYVKKVDPSAIQEGQPITFMLDENTVATHRVVGIVPDEEDPTVIRFRTKGDANEAEDARLVHYKNVIGTPVFSIPYLGYATNYIQHPPECTLRFPQALILLLLMFLPDMFPDDRDEGNKALPGPAKADIRAGIQKPRPPKQHRRKRSAKTGRINLAAKELQQADAPNGNVLPVEIKPTANNRGRRKKKNETPCKPPPHEQQKVHCDTVRFVMLALTMVVGCAVDGTVCLARQRVRSSVSTFHPRRHQYQIDRG